MTELDIILQIYRALIRITSYNVCYTKLLRGHRTVGREVGRHLICPRIYASSPSVNLLK